VALTKQQHRIVVYTRAIFPKRHAEALRVFWCESRYDPYARNGQYVGVPQLSASWRAYFLRYGLDTSAGHGYEQVVAAHEIFRGAGFHWWAWECQP